MGGVDKVFLVFVRPGLRDEFGNSWAPDVEAVARHLRCEGVRLRELENRLLLAGLLTTCCLQEHLRSQILCIQTG